ncbi:alpha/beta fold hydrolase [Kitasatospora gansuensis]
MITLADDLGHLSYTVTGEGSPVLLVHAGVTDHQLWDPVVPALAERHTVIRYDLRGFGESAPRPGRTATPTTCAACWTTSATGGWTWSAPPGAAGSPWASPTPTRTGCGR